MASTVRQVRHLDGGDFSLTQLGAVWRLGLVVVPVVLIWVAILVLL